MAFNKDKYKYVDHTPKSTNVREIIALSSYCGSVVKGVAKCDPEDNFDSNVGEMLAALRCNLKVAEKRLSNATAKLSEAHTAFDVASANLEESGKYMAHAEAEYAEAIRLYNEFYASLS